MVMTLNIIIGIIKNIKMHIVNDDKNNFIYYKIILVLNRFTLLNRSLIGTYLTTNFGLYK